MKHYIFIIYWNYDAEIEMICCILTTLMCRWQQYQMRPNLTNLNVNIPLDI